MKVKFIEGNGVYESFQSYVGDKFLGVNPNNTYSRIMRPLYDTMPVRSGITLEDYFEKKYRGIRKTLICK